MFMVDSRPHNWYGFGMSGGTMVYNKSTSQQLSFQVGGTQITYMFGLTVIF